MPMMHAMERLVEQSEGYELPKPSPGHDASCGTVYGRTGESDVFNILPQALHVRGQPGRRQV